MAPCPIAISLGDPSGIGAEVTAKALCAIARARAARAESPLDVRIFGSALALRAAWVFGLEHAMWVLVWVGWRRGWGVQWRLYCRKLPRNTF